MIQRRTFLALTTITLLLLGWWILPRKSAGEQLQAFDQHYEMTCRIYEQAFASTQPKEEETVALQNLFPNRQYFSQKYQQIADRFPASAEAERALVWLARRGGDPAVAINALFAVHSGSTAMPVGAWLAQLNEMRHSNRTAESGGHVPLQVVCT